MRALAWFSFVALLSCAHPRPAAPAGDPTGIAAFSAFSRFVDAKISPDGSYLAAVRMDGGKRTLGFIDLKNRKLASFFNPKPQSAGDFYWIDNSHVVVELWVENGTLAAPAYSGRILKVDAATGQDNVFYDWGWVLAPRLRRDDHSVLLARPGHDVVLFERKNLHNGYVKQVSALAAEKAESFLVDENGEPRVAKAVLEGVKPVFYYREPGRSWGLLTTLPGIGPISSAVALAGRDLDVIEPMAKGFGLFSVNLDTGARKLLSHNDWVTPHGYLMDDADKRVLAVEHDPDVPAWDFLVPDHPLVGCLKGLLAAYPDENVRITSATDDGKKVVARVYSDRDPGRFLLVDVDHLSAEEIVAARPWIKPEAMAEMTAFHIPASDGTWIHGYVTLPKSSGAPPPLVVLPHGGPHGVRDYWGFDPEAQLLASEGFAVLQVNYRGSGGYGPAFLQAGYGHWGDRIVQDIVDATRYALRKGHADAKRVCIYGGSFGGYAAMQGAIAAPDLFRCAAGYAGIYDLTLLAKKGDIQETRRGREYVRAVLGDDTEALQRISPVYNADRLKARVLLIHGRQDERAPIEHALRLRRALEAAGSPPLWLEEKTEAHGFYDENARLRMYSTLLEFLRANTR